MSTADRIVEIDRTITLLNHERRQLLMGEIKAFQNEHRHNIGRCFKTPGGQYAIITDVPGVNYNHNFDVSFNQYQFPALILESQPDEESHIPFSEDMIFSRNGIDFSDSGFDESPYQEINFEEFSNEFEKRVDAMRSIICAAAKQEET